MLRSVFKRSISLLETVAEEYQVKNQVGVRKELNALQYDKPLCEALDYYNASWAMDHVQHVAKEAGSSTMAVLARQANRNPPILQTHDAIGNRVDVVEYHPAYHELMRRCFELEIPSFAWRRHGKPGAHVARSALGYLMYQCESGTQCPQTMTFAAVPPLTAHGNEEQRNFWVWRAVSNVYNPDNIPAEMKKGVTLGMSMTEKQGGSDVRANTTKAVPTSKHGHDFYLLYGHKWFTSAPMSDAFLTLAQTGKGVTCFIVPRFIPRTSEFNHGLRFQRLKDKLGDRSNASSEVEYHGAYAERLGEEGRGVATILSMVQYTRLDCLVGSAGLMKRCLIEAAYNAENRKVFGSTLIDTPLMRSVLADMALECEAATALAFRIAHCFDSQACLDTHPGQAASNIIKLEAALCRIATPAAKYHICKRAPSIAYECMESLGGNGYVEDGIMARLYRQAPLNAIWEGSGNVICLDLLRCFVREPDAVAALVEFELGKLRGVAADIGPHYDAALVNLTRIVQEAAKGNHGILRTLASTTAMLLQASAMSKTAPKEILTAFIKTRLTPQGQLRGGPHYGQADADLQPAVDLLLDRLRGQ